MFTERILNNLNNDKEAIIFKSGETITTIQYRHLKQIISNIQNEIPPQSNKIAILLENRPEWIASLIAILLYGKTAVPIDCQSSPEEIKNILQDCIPENIIVSETTEALVKQTGHEANVINIDRIQTRNIEDVKFLKANPEDTAVILYTSGTTGDPKGVMLSFKNLNHNVKAIEALKFLENDDRFLSILPFHHIYPLMTTAILPISLGMSIVIVNKITPSEIISALNKFRITILIGVPKLYHIIYQHIMVEASKLPIHKKLFFTTMFKALKILRIKALSSILFKEINRKFGSHLRMMISGGAKLGIEAATALETFGFNIFEGYGLTETSPLVSVNTPSTKKLGSAGKPIPGVEVKIDTNGQILVKGDNVMKGYYNKPEETQKVIKDGWFCTGDLGYIEDGFIHITGRAKEVIVLDNGKNVYPEDLETTLLKSKYISEIGIFEEKGVLKAIVKPDYETISRTGRTIKGSTEHTVKKEIYRILKKFPPYKKPREIIITNKELPRTRIGKLRRFKLPELANNIKMQQYKHP